jgi:hypothetical protein
MSSTTTNKSLNVPGHNAFQNDWDVPCNANWQAIDQALGGTTPISVTGVAGPATVVLTLTQYTCPNIEFTGSNTQQLIYAIPAGVGGIWSMYNNTTGSYSLYIAVSGSASILLPQGYRYLVISDGTTLNLANTVGFANINGQILTSQVPQAAVTQYETDLAIASSQLTGPVPTALTGIWQNSNLPNPGAGPGTVIEPDPGTTPSGTYGQIFYYY